MKEMKDVLKTRHLFFIINKVLPSLNPTLIKASYLQMIKHKWSQNTILIVEDLIISGTEENLVSKTSRVMKMRPFPGVTIEKNIKPLLKKQPDNVIYYVRTNNTPPESARSVLKSILS